jgi:quercetin dioxygenase-like cupin family protein
MRGEIMSQAVTALPITLAHGEGEARWFLGALSTIKASGETTGGRVAVTEHRAPGGHGSPLHVHHNEDEWFYVVSGELTFWIDGRLTTATAGSFVYGPRDVPHTFVVSSEEAHFLLVVEPAGFENFLLELSQPAQSPTLPPASVEPPAPEAMMAAAASYGLEILGPPGIPGE